MPDRDAIALAVLDITLGKDGRRVRSLRQRFSEKYEAEPGGCWRWTGAVRPDGYGAIQMGAGRGTILAHRLSYLIARGPFSEPELDHLCRNRGCINPDHLEPVTASENYRRGLKGELRPPTTHCPAGHDYAIHGRTYPSQPYKICRECANEHQRRLRARRLGVPAPSDAS